MIALYCLLDIVFYNYTNLYTQIFLLTFLEKENKRFFSLFFALIIDYLFVCKGKFFLVFLILFLLNRYLRLNHYKLSSHFLRFFILYVLYQILIFGITRSFYWNLFGFLLNLIFVGFSYKNAPNS